MNKKLLVLLALVGVVLSGWLLITAASQPMRALQPVQKQALKSHNVAKKTISAAAARARKISTTTAKVTIPVYKTTARVRVINK